MMPLVESASSRGTLFCANVLVRERKWDIRADASRLRLEMSERVYRRHNRRVFGFAGRDSSRTKSAMNDKSYRALGERKALPLFLCAARTANGALRA